MGRGEATRRIVLVWLLLAAVSSALLLRAALDPPPGTVFVGTFYYADDFYNYLSYVQQAEDGALVFRNKLAAPHLPPSLVNLEWLGVGWASVLLGGRPLVAYRLVGLLAALAFVALVDRWLARAGMPPGRRLAGLLLVFTGGGAGGLLVATGVLAPRHALDLRAGLFPFVEVLANPHFVAGTVLLLAALLAFAGRRPVAGVLLGSALGLVRPYETAVLIVVVAVAVLLGRPRREWPRRLAPLLGLAPVLAWNAWLFFVSPGFRAFSSARYAALAPGWWELALAVGPAAFVALVTVRRLPDDDEDARRHRLFLTVWAVLGLVVGLARPVPFSLQLLVGIGVPLLGLAAVGLSSVRRGALESAVVLFAGTSLFAVSLASSAGPPWHVPEARWEVARALRPACRAGDVVLAPPDVGLYVGGLTACWPFVSHGAASDFDERDRAARRFYSDEPGAWRSAFLDGSCVRFVVLPTGDPAAREGWSARDDGFRPLPDAVAASPGVGVLARDVLPPACGNLGQ